jgi:GST-like protein
MLKFYYNTAPNPMKVALLLEELGVAYEAVPVDTRKGEQFAPNFLRLNPNAKVPVVVDGETRVFDSNAILLYLAEKQGRFIAADKDRGDLLSWLMFIATGIGPFSGQAVHFAHHAPEPRDRYAVNRYEFEAQRHWKVLEEHLGGRRYMVGGVYSIVDMAFWGWARLLPWVMARDDALDLYPNVKRLLDEVSARPAVAGVEALRGRFKFKTEMDAEARLHMFPQIARLDAAR